MFNATAVHEDTSTGWCIAPVVGSQWPGPDGSTSVPTPQVQTGIAKPVNTERLIWRVTARFAEMVQLMQPATLAAHRRP